MARLPGGGSISATPTLTSPSSFLLAGNTKIIKFDFDIIYLVVTDGTGLSALPVSSR